MTLPRACTLHWKAATRDAIREAGGLDAVAGLLGLSTTQLSRCQTPHHPDLLTAPHALALAEHTGHRGFAEVFAHLAGYRLEPIAPEPGAPASRMKAVAALVSEAAELAHRGAMVMADGQVSDAEMADMLKGAADMADAIDDAHANRVAPPAAEDGA